VRELRRLSSDKPDTGFDASLRRCPGALLKSLWPLSARTYGDQDGNQRYDIKPEHQDRLAARRIVTAK